MTTFSSMPPIPGTGASAGAHDRSSSEIHATKVSASHALTISSYSRSKSVAPCECISSSFTAAGHCWSILYYPNGHGYEDAEYISLFLSCTDDRDVKARATMCLLDKDGKLAYTSKSQTRFYTSMSGDARFMRRKELERSGHVDDDRLRIRCDMSVLKPVRKFVDVPPSSDIFRRLGDLLSSGFDTDVMFEVDGGETFHAHRIILAARSPVFRAGLFGPMKEGTATTCVWIQDMEPRVFEAMLHFVYNDVLPDIDEGEAMAMAQHLLVAADRYCLDRLKLICEEKLCNYIDTGNVGTMLALADQHGCHGLRKACLNFVAI